MAARRSGARSRWLNPFVKHQLLILNRSPKQSPYLRTSDRVIANVCALFMRPAG